MLDGRLEGNHDYDDNNRGNTCGPDGNSDGMSDSGWTTVDDNGIVSGKSWSRDGT